MLGNDVNGDLFLNLPKDALMGLCRCVFLVTAFSCYPLAIASQMSQWKYFVFTNCWSNTLRIFLGTVVSLVTNVLLFIFNYCNFCDRWVDHRYHTR